MVKRHGFFVVYEEPLSDAGMVIDVIEAAGHKVDYSDRMAKHQTTFDPAKHCGLVLLGSNRASADDRRKYASEIDWAIEAKQSRRAILGICHGAQLLAHVFGAKLSTPKSPTDRGLTHLALTAAGAGDPVLRHVQNVKVAQWHSHWFATPEGAIELARSTREDRQHCEAFRVGQNIYGLQFHPEPTAKQLLGEWKSREQAETFAATERAGRAVLESWVAIAMRG